jgi:hypothetical protein
MVAAVDRRESQGASGLEALKETVLELSRRVEHTRSAHEGAVQRLAAGNEPWQQTAQGLPQSYSLLATLFIV